MGSCTTAHAAPPAGYPLAITGDVYEGAACYRDVRLVWYENFGEGWEGQAGNLQLQGFLDGSGGATWGYSDYDSGFSAYTSDFPIFGSFPFNYSFEAIDGAGTVYRFVPHECDFGSGYDGWRITTLVMYGFVGCLSLHWSAMGMGAFFSLVWPALKAGAR